VVKVGGRGGGGMGVAIGGTVAWSAVASTRQSAAAAAAAAAQAGAHPSAGQTAALKAQIYHHALATGFSQGYLVSAGVLVLSLVIALFVMRVSRADLSGAGPAPEPAGHASAPGPTRDPQTPPAKPRPPRPSAETRGLGPERGRGQQAQRPGAGDGLGPGVRAELAVQVGDVGPDRVVRDAQLAGDLRPGQVGGQVAQHA